MASRGSFLRHLRQAVLPQPCIDRLFLVAVLFSASSYWIVSRYVHPDEPESIAAMYRAGDIENYPFISALSRGQLSESVVREHAGKGVTPFLLSRIVELSGGASLEANVKLFHNNVRLACRIALACVKAARG